MYNDNNKGKYKKVLNLRLYWILASLAATSGAAYAISNPAYGILIAILSLFIITPAIYISYKFVKKIDAKILKRLMKFNFICALILCSNVGWTIFIAHRGSMKSEYVVSFAAFGAIPIALSAIFYGIIQVQCNHLLIKKTEPINLGDE